MFILIKRIFRSGWQGLRRNGGMITANIFVITMAIFVVTSLFFFRDISRFLISSIEEKADISVYFKDEAEEEDILKIKEEVFGIPEVKEVRYVSKEEALRRFTEKRKKDPRSMEALVYVGKNPFLASLGIKAFQADQYITVVNFLENFHFNYLIEKHDYYERELVIQRIFSLTSTFNKAGIVFSILLALIAVLVTFNTVRLSIYNSREEIKVQRLVGASNWFIRGPFLVQGAIYGFFAVLICLSLFALLSWGLDAKAELLMPGFGLFSFFVSNFWLILLIQLLSGISLGALSSLIAVRKHLEV